MKLILSGEPKSTQHIYRNTCRGSYSTTYMMPEGKAIKEAYQWEAKSQWKGKPLEEDIEATVHFYFGTKRKDGLDSFSKLLQDSSSA